MLYDQLTYGIQKNFDQWRTQKIFMGDFNQWHMVGICIWCAMFVTSQFDVIVMFPNQRFGEICWHNMHILPHTLPLIYVSLHWIYTISAPGWCWVRFCSSTWNVLWFWNNNKRRHQSLKENNWKTQSRSLLTNSRQANRSWTLKTLFIVKLYLRIYCTIMLGESNHKPYNITLKNVVQTMIKIVIEITNDLEWLSFLEKCRHVRPIAQDARAQCVTARTARRNQPMKIHEKIDIYLCHCSVQQSSGLTKLFT